MNFTNAVGVGLKEILAHPLRSLLTLFGILLGVSALVAMSAIIAGNERGLKEGLTAIGGLQKVRIEAQPVPVEQRYLRDFATGVTIQDVQALEAGVPELLELSPQIRLDIPPVLTVNGKRTRVFMTSGCLPQQLEMMEHAIGHGRMFNAIDNEQARSVCVIGTGIRDDLWGKPTDEGEEVDPVGRLVAINGEPFTVIGMFQHYEGEQDRKARELAAAERQSKRAEERAAGITNAVTAPNRNRGWGGGGGRRGNFSYWIKNNTVYLPLETMRQKFILGDTNANPHRISVIEAKIRDVERLDTALTQIRNVLMVTHHGIEDFAFRTQEDWADRIQDTMKNARISGGLIAGISLFVGGIGIMNIMLASISERIREIGIRKAVGAAGPDIFIQILVESVVIAGLGGLSGLAASGVMVWIISQLTPTENAPVITWPAMAVALSFSLLVGIVAGLFPAIKAARMNVIQALRYD